MKYLSMLLLTLITFGCSKEKKKLPEEFDYGKAKDGLYKNSYFDLTIQYNPNWVLQSQEQVDELVDQGSELAAGDNENLKNVIKASKVTTAYLLTLFKHEVGAAVESNPSFMAIAENTKSSPGIKTGEDYLFHTKKLLAQSQIQYSFEKDVYEKTIGDRTFHVLEGKIQMANGGTMTQEYIVTVMNGFSLTFVATYTNEDEKGELYKIIDSIKI